MSTLELIGYPLFVVAALELVLAFILLRHDSNRSPVNRSVAAFSLASAAFSLSTALMYVRAAAGDDYILFARINWIGWLSIPAALQFIFYLRDESSRRGRIVGYVLYPLWAVFLGLSLFTDLVVTDVYQLLPFYNNPGPLEKPARLLGGLLILWLMIEIVRLRRSVTGLKRAQLNYFFHGTLIFATAGSLTAGFLQVAGEFGVEPGLASYFSFPWVVLTFYAISRYRLFDIRIVLSHTLSGVLLFSFFAAGHIALFGLLEPMFGHAYAILVSLSAMTALFLGTPLNRRIRDIIRRLVLQDRFNYQDVLRESVKAVVTILEFSELLDYLVGTIQRSLRSSSVCLYLKDEHDQFPLLHGYSGMIDVLRERPLDSGVVELIRQAGQSVVREELERILPAASFGPLSGYMKEIGAELVIPLRYKGALQGVLTVGYKGDGEHYSQSDIDLLDALAGHAAVAIENARLYEEARRVQESLRESEARFTSMIERTIQRYLAPERQEP